jgi:hypothetical protein
MKLEFLQLVSEKYSSIKFHENRPVGAELFHADRHEKANSLFSQFCESA